jgi:UDP-2,3-diacylglucosamine pyrophosphatase LpxH
MNKRKVDTVVISDIHLGTYGAHADELLQYLESIEVRTLILNGDIIDMWQFRRKFFPLSHTKVLMRLCNMIEEGVMVHYITGNHDDALRVFSPFKIGNLKLSDKLLTLRSEKKVWIFHGDVFDASVNHAKWIAKLGGVGYDFLIRINRFFNNILKIFNKPPVSLSKKIKNNIKNAVKFISDFENTAIELAIDQEYDYVICGHIHQPTIRKVVTEKGETTYMNSGDWVENLTALEFNEGKWTLYKYDPKDYPEQSIQYTYSRSFRPNKTFRMTGKLASKLYQK